MHHLTLSQVSPRSSRRPRRHIRGGRHGGAGVNALPRCGRSLWIGIVFIVVPIFTPIANELGFNQIWFALLVMVNLQISFLTPPFAYSIFYLKSGRLSEDEYAILDELNGLVLACEIALERLQRAAEVRLRKKGERFNNHYELASFIYDKVSEKTQGNHNG